MSRLRRGWLTALLLAPACTVPVVPADGSTDLGARDLGADSGSADSSADTGAPDLGPPDLGPPDLGSPDLGPPDMGYCPLLDGGMPATFYADCDGDGYGGTMTRRACTAPAGATGCPSRGGTWVSPGGDCDDANTAVHPGVTEVCDGVDNDCNAMTDDGVSVTCYVDGDADGYALTGAASVMACACGMHQTTRAPTVAVDCDDADVNAHPTQTSFFTTARMGSTPASFDYDCDGTETRQHPTMAGACGGGTCGGAPGWTGTGGVPACGVAGTYLVACIPAGFGTCVPSTAPMTQGCR